MLLHAKQQPDETHSTQQTTTGKVWHMKHFCCAECRIPLGGHPYIIVDAALNQARSRRRPARSPAPASENPDCCPSASKLNLNGASANDHNNHTDQPFCLKCFDAIFGETCAQCGKLITCDSGAINHELKSWHASDECFKCHQCHKSLVGCPFLPNQDGNIYCSVVCSELNAARAIETATVTETTSKPSETPLATTATSQHNQKLANQQQQQHRQSPLATSLDHQRKMDSTTDGPDELLAATARKWPTAEAANCLNGAVAWNGSLMRHKPLIDYLIMSAQNDESSYELLQYLQAQFSQSLCGQMKAPDAGSDHTSTNTNATDNDSANANKTAAALKEELTLFGEIDYTLKKLRGSGTQPEPDEAKASTKRQQQEQLRRNKLNPFLMDAAPAAGRHPHLNGNGQQLGQGGDLVCMMMDRMLNGPRALLNGDDRRRPATKLDYINLDSIRLDELEKRTGANHCEKGGSRAKLGQRRQQQQQQKQHCQQIGGASPAIDCVDRVGEEAVAAAAAAAVADASEAKAAISQQQFARLVGGIQQAQRKHSKLSQCSPVASLISNEGTISDHSQTSSGVSTAPPGRGSIDGSSLKSHSPLSSTSSQSSVVSSSSLISSASAGAGSQVPGAGSSIMPATTTANHHQAGSLHQRQSSQPAGVTQSLLGSGGSVAGDQSAGHRRRQSPAISSIAASLERRRRVQPITELSVVDLLAVADDQMHTSLLGAHQRGSSQEPASLLNDGFDRLVRQFTNNSGGGSSSNDNSVKRNTIGPRGSMSQFGQSASTSLRSQRGGARQQPESFFFELAQRLPRTQADSLVSGQQQRHQQNGLRVATGGPLDTNGLPTAEEDARTGGGGQAQAPMATSSSSVAATASSTAATLATSAFALVASGSSPARTITDHYSTVNKAHKQQQQHKQANVDKQQQPQQQQVADEEQHENWRRRRTCDDFFAITSPLLDCQIDTLTTEDTVAPQKRHNAIGQQQQQHPSQMTRPTSSLSIFASANATPNTPAANGGLAASTALHGSYSTNSLNRHQIGQQTLLLQPTAASSGANSETTAAATTSQANKQQKPLTRPAKSVSFDPNVKDPPSSSTLGRASTLKSALKQSQPPNWNQQDHYAFHELAAAAMHHQQQLQLQQQQHPFPIASSATMPASFAAQLKAATGSMAAYNAYYDEFGRRIKLSTLLQQQQLQQQILDPTTATNPMLVEEQDSQQQQLESNKSSKAGSSPLPGVSLLAKLTGSGGGASSRGGRREQRKACQEQQAIQIQPGSILQMAPIPPAEFDAIQMQQTTSGGLSQLQEPSYGARQSTPRRGPPSTTSGSSRRSRRSSSSYRRVRYRRDRAYRSRRRASSSRRAPPRCTSRHCRSRSCLYDSDEDDYSSSCSTCSSSSSTCADDDDYTDYESEHRQCSAAKPSSETKIITTATYVSDEASSYTSYTSASESSSEEDAYDDEVEDRRRCTSNSSSVRAISPSFRSTKANRTNRRRRSSCSSSSHYSATRHRSSTSSNRSRPRRPIS
jgi:hypothetical protein